MHVHSDLCSKVLVFHLKQSRIEGTKTEIQ